MFHDLINVSAFMSQLFGVSLFGAIVVIVRYVMAFLKRLKLENKAMKEAIKGLLQNSLFTMCNVHISKGYITSQEYSSLHQVYISYIALGGNGVIVDLFERVKNLELRSDSYEQD